MSLSLKPASTSSAATPPRLAAALRSSGSTIVHNAVYAVELDSHGGCAPPFTVHHILSPPGTATTGSPYDNTDAPITLTPPRPVRPPTPLPRDAPPEVGDVAESSGLSGLAAAASRAPRHSPAEMDSGEIADNEADDASSGLLASRDESLPAAAAAAAGASRAGTRAMLEQPPALRTHDVGMAGAPKAAQGRVLTAGSPVAGLAAAEQQQERPLDPEVSPYATLSEAASTPTTTALLECVLPETTGSLRANCMMPARTESAASTLASTTLLGAGPPAITSAVTAAAVGAALHSSSSSSSSGGSSPGGASPPRLPPPPPAPPPLAESEEMSIDGDLRGAAATDLAALDGCAKARRLVGGSPAADDSSNGVASLEATRSLDSAGHSAFCAAPHWLQPGAPPPPCSRSGGGSSTLMGASGAGTPAWEGGAKRGLRFRIDGDMGLVGCVRALFVASSDPHGAVGEPLCSVLRRHRILDNLPATCVYRRAGALSG